MRKLNLKLLLPYNWAHIRKIKVYDDKKRLLTKIMHGEEPEIEIPDDSKQVIIKLDFYKSVITIPQGENLHLILFMDFRDRFPIKYFDTLKRKCLTGKFVTQEEFEDFSSNFYANAHKWIHKTEVDKGSLFLGFLLSVGLTVMSVVEQNNPYQDIIFMIGLASFFSLLAIQIENHKILLYDYKSRMIASGAAFMLGSIFLQSSFPLIVLFILFSLTFLLKSIHSIGQLYRKVNLGKD